LTSFAISFPPPGTPTENRHYDLSPQGGQIPALQDSSPLSQNDNKSTEEEFCFSVPQESIKNPFKFPFWFEADDLLDRSAILITPTSIVHSLSASLHELLLISYLPPHNRQLHVTWGLSPLTYPPALYLALGPLPELWYLL